MTDKIPVRYLPTEEAQPALGEYRSGETVPVIHGGTGADTPEAARLNLGIVAAPGSVTEYPYTVALPPTATPLSGEISLDSATPASVTTLYFHKLDGLAQDQTQFLQSIKANDWVNLYLASDTDTYQRYDATGPAVQNGDVYAVPVVYYDHQNGPLADAYAVNAYWRIASDPTPWGDITGTLSNQADLQGELDGKASTTHASTHATGQSDALAPLSIGAVASSDGTVVDAVALTQAEYDGLTPDPSTLYLITG